MNMVHVILKYFMQHVRSSRKEKREKVQLDTTFKTVFIRKTTVLF